MSLGSWKKNLKSMINDLSGELGDSDHPSCPECGATMEFYGHDDDGDFPYGEGYWKCDNCGYKVSENEL